MHDNARPERKGVFGFPDFVPTAEAEYPRFFEAGPHVLTAMHSVADREYAAPEPHQLAILNPFMLACVSLVEVVVLTVRGGALRDAQLVQFPVTVGVWAIFVLLFVKLK